MKRAQKRTRALYESAVSQFTEATLCTGVSTAPNAVYGHDDLARCVAEACVQGNNVFMVAESERGTQYPEKYARGGGLRPCGEWFRRAMSGCSAGQAKGQFDQFNRSLIPKLQARGLLTDEMDLSMDYHNIKRYDKKPGPDLVRGGDKNKRKKEFYETYATVQCVVAGQRLALGIEPYVPGDDHAGSVKALLGTVAGHALKVGVITLDRGFYSTDVFSALQSSGHDWLMPCPNSPYVKEAIAEYAAGKRGRVSKGVITQSSKKECEYDMIIVPRKNKRKVDGKPLEPWEKYIAFATNDPAIDVAEYAKRWGIETGYRQSEETRAKTRSSSHGPRVMCWAMTLMLFNAWIFVDAMHRLDCEVYRTRPAIKLHSALTAMSKIPCSGPGPPE